VDRETAELLPTLKSQPPAKRAKPASNGGRERRIERRQLADALWGTLTIGALVLAPELDRDGTYLAGWWEAVIVAMHGGGCILGWRDYPDEGLFRRARHYIAMLYPAG
jgi:hypothetical protein